MTRHALALAIAALFTPITASAQDTPAREITPTSPAQPAAPAVAQPPTSPEIQSILNAKTGSDALDAYARATLRQPDGSLPDKAPADAAFLAKMVELGLPEIAAPQANDIIKREPRNDLAWAVVAHDKARRGEMAGALSAITAATTPTDDRPLHPFTLRTFGSMLAWYDQNKASVQMAPDAAQTLEQRRTVYSADPAFAESFKQATEAYTKAATPAAPTPPGQQPTGDPAGANYTPPVAGASPEQREWTNGDSVSTTAYPYTSPLDHVDTGVPYVDTSPYIYSSGGYEWRPAPYYGTTYYYYGSPSYYHGYGRPYYNRPGWDHDWSHGQKWRGNDNRDHNWRDRGSSHDWRDRDNDRGGRGNVGQPWTPGRDNSPGRPGGGSGFSQQPMGPTPAGPRTSPAPRQIPSNAMPRSISPSDGGSRSSGNNRSSGGSSGSGRSSGGSGKSSGGSGDRDGGGGRSGGSRNR